MSIRNWIKTLFLVLTLTGLQGCTEKNPPEVFHTVSKILASPAEWEGRQVRLKGTVSGLFSVAFVDHKVYSLKDETGEITVLAMVQAPALGERVAITGVAKNLVMIGTFSTGLVIYEKARL